MNTETIPLAAVGMGFGVLAIIGTAFVAFFKWMWPNYRGAVMEENPSVKQQFKDEQSRLEKRWTERVEKIEAETREGFLRLEQRIASAEQTRGDNRERLTRVEALTEEQGKQLQRIEDAISALRASVEQSIIRERRPS